MRPMATRVTFVRAAVVGGVSYAAGQTAQLPDDQLREFIVSGYGSYGDQPTPLPRLPLAALQRSNHLGTQPASTISDFNEAAQDAVASMLVSGANVTLAYNDTANTLQVTAAAGSGGADAETIRDTIGAAIVGLNGVVVAVNDNVDTITFTVSGLSIAQTAGLQAALDAKADAAATTTALASKASTSSLNAHTTDTNNPHVTTKAHVGLANVPNVDATVRSTHTGTQPASTISDFTEAAQDAVAALLASGANVTLTYNDAGNTLQVTASGTDAETVRDTIGAALVGIQGVTVAVNDNADTITLGITGLTIAQVTGLQAALDSKEPTLAAGATTQYLRGDKTWQTLNSAAVGLPNVPNVDPSLAQASATADSYALSRLDATAADLSRNGGYAAVARQVAAGNPFTETWGSTANWLGVGTVANGRMYSTAAIMRAAPTAARWVARSVIRVQGTTGAFAYFGVSSDAPSASITAANVLGMGMTSSSGAISDLKGANIAGTVVKPRTYPSTAIPAGEYLVTIAVDETHVSMTLQSKTDLQYVYGQRITKSQLPGGAVNSIWLSASGDATASGVNWGPVVVHNELSVPPTSAWSPGSYALFGAGMPLVVMRADTSTGVGHMISVPGNVDPRIPVPLVLFAHQAGSGTSTTPWSDTRMANVISALDGAGYAVAASDNGPATTQGGTQDKYGNQAGMDDYAAAVNWARAHFPVGSLMLLGASQGTIFVQNLLQKRVLSGVAAAASISLATDLIAVEADATFQSAIRTAYGATSSADFATKVAGFNPAAVPGAGFRGVPQKFYVGSNDATAPPATHVTAFVATLAPYVPEATVVSLPVGHLDASLYQGSDLVTFFNKYVKSPGTTLASTVLLSDRASIGASMVFGDGSDCAVNMDGTNTYAGFASKAGSVYTLTRDMLASTLVIASGATLQTAGFRVHATTSIVNNGTISFVGANGAANGTAGTAVSQVLTSASGGAGNTGAGSAGNIGTIGGAGSAGGTGSGGAGGSAAGSVIATTVTFQLRTPYPVLVGLVALLGASRTLSGGSGGSGGGGDTTNKGGGGGSGGGVIALLSPIVTNSGTITAQGGSGGTPTTGNGGGGGGGGGGAILVYSTAAWTAGTTNVAGGGGGAGVGTGTAGATGATGRVLNVVLAA